MGRKRKVRPAEQQQEQERLPPQQEEEKPVEEQTNPEENEANPVQEDASTFEENEEENTVEEEKEADEEEAEEEDTEGNNENEAEQVNSSNEVAANEQALPPEANGGKEEKEEEEEEDEDGDEEFEEEPLETLLEPFSKEQLVVLLKEAVSKYPDFTESVRKLADADPAHRKIFVHGLGWDANTETLTSVFGKYGEIEDCKAVSDKVSGKCKGYGFILFKHRSGARKALHEPQKKIGNRMTSCQLASAGPVPAPPPTVAASPPVSEYTQRKIFVSNVSADIDPQKLLEFFTKFGEIEDGPLGLDKLTGKPKGFALFVYKTIESAKKALEEPNKNFEGHTFHCQRAIDGPKPNKQPYFQQHYHQQQQGQYQHHPSKKGKYSSGSGSGSAHLMAPSGPAVGFNTAVAATGMNPAIGQALTALTALTQGSGLGITNLLGGLGAPVNQGGPPVINNTGYGNQGIGGYGNQQGALGGYQSMQSNQGSGRLQQGGPSYMGHGR